MWDVLGPAMAISGFVALAIAIPVVISYFVDRSAHEGVDWFRRRRIRRTGQRAAAKILSSNLSVAKSTGSKYAAAYSIVYEVRPEGAPPFRARGIEVLRFSEANANHVEVGVIVAVRFDPTDNTVVLERVDIGKARRDREAEQRAKEDALLRGK